MQKQALPLSFDSNTWTASHPGIKTVFLIMRKTVVLKRSFFVLISV